MGRMCSAECRMGRGRAVQGNRTARVNFNVFLDSFGSWKWNPPNSYSNLEFAICAWSALIIAAALERWSAGRLVPANPRCPSWLGLRRVKLESCIYAKNLQVG